MYTINPLPIVDTINSHDGFYFLAALIGAPIALWWASTCDSYGKQTRHANFVLIYLALIAWPAWDSWHSGSITVPKNEPVTVQLVEFWGETHKEDRQQGKTRTTVDVHNQYVSYRTPDGIVSFPFVAGVPYLETAILYKN